MFNHFKKPSTLAMLSTFATFIAFLLVLSGFNWLVVTYPQTVKSTLLTGLIGCFLVFVYSYWYTKFNKRK